MQHETTPSLVDRLRHVAGLWATANDASLARLGKLAVNDGGFFTRLETQTKGTTTATLEAFATVLADAANWPEGLVPEEVREFAHVTGVCPIDVVPSAGIGGTSSPSLLDASSDAGRPASAGLGPAAGAATRGRACGSSENEPGSVAA